MNDSCSQFSIKRGASITLSAQLVLWRIATCGVLLFALTSDLPLADADADPFAEIGVGRVVAENVSFATLYASRVLTYASLLDAQWQDRACQARWENAC